MGKKAKAPQPDADGYLKTGIYQRYVGPQRASLREHLDRLVAEHQKSRDRRIVNWLEDITEFLSEFILPVVDDETGKKRQGGHYYSLDLGNGPRIYRLKDSVIDGTPECEAAMDAIHALYEVRTLQAHISGDDKLTGSLRYAVDAAFKLGRIVERIPVRSFEPVVATELSRRKKRGERRKQEARLTDQQWELVKAFIERRTRKGDSAAKACDQAAAQLTTGTFPKLKNQSIEISSKSLQNRWSNRNK